MAKGSEVQFGLNLFSRNFLEPEPEPELELNFAFGPEGSGLNQGSGPNFGNTTSNEQNHQMLRTLSHPDREC